LGKFFWYVSLLKKEKETPFFLKYCFLVFVMAVAAMAPLASHTNSGEVVSEREAGAVVNGQPGASPHLQFNSSEIVENS
jgi:hypothetical protein